MPSRATGEYRAVRHTDGPGGPGRWEDTLVSRMPELLRSTRAPRRRLTTTEKVFVALLTAIVVLSFMPAPLWRLAWRYPAYQRWSFGAATDAAGRPREAWRWVEGRTIRVAQLPNLKRPYAQETAQGVRDLLRDAGLNVSVEVRPMSEALHEAYRASLRRDGAETRLSFTDLESRLVGMRDGDPHADVLIVDAPIAGSEWAFGMGAFRSGLVVIHQSMAGRSLAKHEAGHLMGYMMHDNFPVFVLGYPWEGWPWSRSTLMLLASKNPELSPRARDALRALWRFLEKSTDRTYLTPLPS